MTKPKLLIILFLLVSVKMFGQKDYKKVRDEILLYKKIYFYSDSVRKIRKAGFIDSEILPITDSLDKVHPLGYYQKAAEFMKASKFNEASFLYYLGYLRYRYYNITNPEYPASGDGALLTSLNYVLGEQINTYLKTNIDNYIEILKESADWYTKHDYKFYSKDKNAEKYLEQSKGLNNSIADLENNKAKYQAEWNIETDKFKSSIDQILEQVEQKIKEGDK